MAEIPRSASPFEGLSPGNLRFFSPCPESVTLTATDGVDADALVTPARGLAEYLLGDMGTRWRHTHGVAHRASPQARGRPWAADRAATC